VALSAHGDDRSVEHMLASGATSYLLKDSSLDDIVDALIRSVDGDVALSDSITEHVVAELSSRLAREEELAEERRSREARIRHFIDGSRALSIVFQPIIDVSSERIVGVEALSRFLDEPKRGPDVWFSDAEEVGLGKELQLAALDRALPAIDRLPVDVFLSVNVDARTAASRELADTIGCWPSERIVIELTEHSPADNYPRLRKALEAFQRSGVRVAVDDAGAGFASLRHILELAPDVIKLDISIVRDIDTERAHRAVASALVGFAHEIGTDLIAEGVETVEEAKTLADLGIQVMQGYHFARPGPLPDRYGISLVSSSS
jgi:EAL domain-containing protein (putative c-di-GMP-specific phosphodiesterase class I)